MPERVRRARQRRRVCVRTQSRSVSIVWMSALNAASNESSARAKIHCRLEIGSGSRACSTSTNTSGMIFLLCRWAIADSSAQTTELADEGLMTNTNDWPLIMAVSISDLHCALGGIPSQSTQALRPFSTSAAWMRSTNSLSSRAYETKTSVDSDPPT